MLESLSLERKASGLDSIKLVYPEEPFAVLHVLHVRDDEAGPALVRARLEQLNDEVREWRTGIVEVERVRRSWPSVTTLGRFKL